MRIFSLSLYQDISHINTYLSKCQEEQDPEK